MGIIIFNTDVCIFPVLVQGLKKLKLKNYSIGSIFLAISVISGLVMAYVFYITSKSPEGANFSRIYYGTDTRAFSFFCAAGLACFYSNREIKSNIEKKIIYVLGILGMISLAIFSFEIDYKNSLNYYGLMFLVSVLFSFSIVLFSKPELKKFDISKYNKILNPVIRLGQHQYQYYLWQYPVMIFAREYFKWIKLPNLYQFYIQLAVLIIISELSYYLFEKKNIKYISYPILTAIVLILVFSPVYVNKDLEEMKAMQAAANDTVLSEEKKDTSTSVENAGDKPLTMDELLTSLNTSPKNEKEDMKSQNEIMKKYPNDERDILFVGDSVLDMTKIDLKKKYPNAIIQTKSGRQFHELPNMLKSLSQDRKLTKIVVIALGTNGAIYEKDMKSVLQILQGHDVYFVNTVMPDPWQDSVNAEIKKAGANPNIKVIDWYSYSKGKQEYFYKDGTHPKPNAGKRYINLIYSVLSKDILNQNK